MTFGDMRTPVVTAGCSGGEVHDGPDRDAADASASDEQNVGVNGGDCTGRVRFRGVVYRSSNATNEQPPLGIAVGSGDTAIATTDAAWRAVYIDEDVAAGPSSWPEVLRNQRAVTLSS